MKILLVPETEDYSGVSELQEWLEVQSVSFRDGHRTEICYKLAQFVGLRTVIRVITLFANRLWTVSGFFVVAHSVNESS